MIVLQGLFVTATGTDAGKTLVTGLLASAWRKRGIRTGVFKPLASGALRNEEGQLLSGDASFLMQAAGLDEKDRAMVNPVCLEPALTPAVAARLSGITVDMKEIIKNIQMAATDYDLILVEGAGGLIAPLWENYCAVDLLRDLHLPAVLVGGSGLGSINEVVLSAYYCQQEKIPLKSVILNHWPENPGPLEKENALYMRKLTGLPVDGKVHNLKKAEAETNDYAVLAEIAEKYIDIDRCIAYAKGEL